MKKIIVTTAFALVVLFASLVNAQTTRLNFSEKEILNFVEGIKSNNLGLKRCSIYLAAKYQVVETVPAMVDEFKNEINPKNKVLIALALYQIGDEGGIEAVYNASLSDENPKVRKTCSEVMNNFKSSGNVVSNE